MNLKTSQAISDSVDAVLRVRNMKAEAKLRPPSACQRHMPFTEHRTVAQIWAAEAAAKKRMESAPVRKAMQYGYDPQALETGR